MEVAREQAHAMERESRPEGQSHNVSLVRTSTPYKNINRKRNWKSARKDPKKSCHNCGQGWPHPGGRTSRPAYGRTCGGCNKQNHFQKCCRSSKTVAKTRQVNQVDTIPKDDSDDSYLYLS